MIGVRGLALIVLLGAVFSEPETYKGHKLYRAFPKSQSDVDYLDKLLKQGDDGIDFWSYPARSLDPVDIHADPASTQKLEDLLDGAEISFKIDTEDLAPLIEAEKAAPRAGGFDSKYHRLGEIHQELRRLVSQYSSHASTFSLGKSYEGRDQLAIKIMTPGKKKGVFFFNCGIHAREWISPATCMYMLRNMLERSTSDSSVKKMLDDYEWNILPVFNVDGYEYTHTRNRMWRKTRKPYGARYGADPNRNFNYHFAGVGTSQRPSSDIYTGPRPFSEKVTYNVAKYLYKRRSEVKGYIDFHAYSQMWMSPWGYTRSYPPHYSQHVSVHKSMTHLYATANTSSVSQQKSLSMYQINCNFITSNASSLIQYLL